MADRYVEHLAATEAGVGGDRKQVKQIRVKRRVDIGLTFDR